MVLPARGRLHQRAVRLHRPARRGRHDRDGRQPDPSFRRSIPTRPSRACATRAGARSSAISRAGAASEISGDARRIREQYFSSDDQLLTMVMGGEIYLRGLRGDAGRSAASSTFRSRFMWSAPSACPDLRRLGEEGQVRPGQHLHPHDRHVGRRAGRRPPMRARMCRCRCRSRCTCATGCRRSRRRSTSA
jgi:hypothetical protein